MIWKISYPAQLKICTSLTEPPKNNESLQLLLKILTALFIVMFPVGLLIMLTDYGKQFIWTTTLFLAVQSLILFLIVNNTTGVLKSLILTLLIMLLSFLIEYIGVKTGFPFGVYNYSEILPPLVLGVPLAITFAWFSLTISSYILTVSLYGKAGIYSVSFISAVLILAADILLEPFASFINGFWIWNNGVINFQNFISWLVIGFLFCVITSVFIPPEKIRSLNPLIRKIPFIVFAANILTFLVLNVIHGYLLISAIAIIIIEILTIILPGAVKSEA